MRCTLARQAGELWRPTERSSGPQISNAQNVIGGGKQRGTTGQKAFCHSGAGSRVTAAQSEFRFQGLIKIRTCQQCGQIVQPFRARLLCAKRERIYAAQCMPPKAKSGALAAAHGRGSSITKSAPQRSAASALVNLEKAAGRPLWLKSPPIKMVIVSAPRRRNSSICHKCPL